MADPMNTGNSVPADIERADIDKAFLFGDLDRVLELLQLSPEPRMQYRDGILCSAIKEDRMDVVSALLDKGLDVNGFSDGNARTLLHLATESGSENVVRLLLENKADVNARTIDLHYCPLHVAFKYGWTSIAVMLINAGSNVNVYASNGYAPLHVATVEGQLEGVHFLLDRGVDVNMPSGHGNTALHISIMECHYEVTKLLLEYNIDVDLKNDSGWCALHGAAEAGKVKFVDLLLEHGADINALTTFVLYRTPLMLAATSGVTQVVASLLKCGAETDIVTQYGETALHLAIVGRHLSIVKLLVQQNIDLEVATHLGHTPVHFAAKAQDIPMLTFLLEAGSLLDSNEKGQLCLRLAIDSGDLHLVTLCVQQGVSPNIPLSVCGQTALHHAVRQGSKELVKLLLELGADPNTTTEDCGETPLHVAAYGETENEDLMELLIRHGADVDAIFQQCNWTALTIVMENGLEGCTRLLLDNGADVSGMTDDGETALHIAAREGFTEGVQLLLGQDVGFTLSARDHGGDMPHHKTVYGDHQLSLHKLLLRLCPLNTEDGLGETALEHATTAKSFGCTVLLIIHGAVYDDILLEYILVTEKESMVNIFDIFLNSGNSSDDPFQILFFNAMTLPQEQKAFRAQVRERVQKTFSLKMLVRMSIRNHLIKVNDDQSIVPAIKSLPLPRVVREHLLLKEYSEFLETEVFENMYDI